MHTADTCWRGGGKKKPNEVEKKKKKEETVIHMYFSIFVEKK